MMEIDWWSVAIHTLFDIPMLWFAYWMGQKSREPSSSPAATSPRCGHSQAFTTVSTEPMPNAPPLPAAKRWCPDCLGYIPLSAEPDQEGR
jgi:hypothetical protein